MEETERRRRLSSPCGVSPLPNRFELMQNWRQPDQHSVLKGVYRFIKEERA
jgi:hypothetical protein